MIHTRRIDDILHKHFKKTHNDTPKDAFTPELDSTLLGATRQLLGAEVRYFLDTTLFILIVK